MHLLETRAYRHAFELYIRRGVPVERSLNLALEAKEEARSGHSTTHYIWHTAGDEKVRASHAENEGKIFSWDEPPEVGHPGEGYNCRCTAEPYIEGETEFAYQELVGEIPSKIFNRWNTADFLNQFFFGNSEPIDLAKTGNLLGLINFYNYKIIRNGKTPSERLKAQIIDEARKHPSGKFTYIFNASYDFENFIFAFGKATVSGQFTGNVQHKNGVMAIEGSVDFKFKDTITDIFSEREKEIGTSNPNKATAEMLKKTEHGGNYYDVIGRWATNFKAEAKYDETSSRYVWD
ncbi:MAG: phage minor head protein [Pseudomonadota bacterium]